MKFRRLFKKAAAALMAAVTALSVLPATTAFAAGDIGTISFTHTYDSSGNTMRYNSSAVFDGYTAGGTGKYKYRMFVDGENAFCIQPGVPLKTGNTLKKASSDTWNALSTNQKKAVGLALLYGYQGNRSHLSGSDDEKWLATQTLVWEFVTGCREATGSYQQNSTKAYSLHFGSNYPNSGAKAAYDQIVSLLSEHNTIPSFMSGGKNDITKELAYKDGKYSITLTDKNGVLSDYSFSSSDGNVSVSKSGNKLTISSAVAVSGSVRITAKRNGVPTVSDSAKMIAYGDPNLQDLVGLSWYSAPGITQRDGKPAPQIRRTKIMSDNRKYYYLKLKESYFDDDAIVLLESMQDGMLYSNILLKLYLKSLKYGGTLQLDENIPYTAQMIATITRQQVGTVERALQIFMKLGLVEPLDNGALYMSNIELFIGQSSTEGERKRRARMKISEQKRLSGQVSEAKADICPPEIEIKKEIDIEIEKERELKPGRATPAAYGRYKNVILTEMELSELQAELPDKWEYYIDRLSGYIASTGKKYKNHAATIRRWAADDTAKAAPKKGIPDYTYKEGESL